MGLINDVMIAPQSDISKTPGSIEYDGNNMYFTVPQGTINTSEIAIGTSGTASYALYAVSASYKTTYETSSSYADYAKLAESSSYATTASYALNGGGSTGVWEAGSGTNSVQTVGTGCVASGENSIAEGQSNYAAGTAAHAEGIANVAGLSIFDTITGGQGTDTITVAGDKSATYTDVLLLSTSSGYEAITLNSVSAATYDAGTDTTTIVLNTASGAYDGKIFDTLTTVNYTHVQGGGNIASGAYSSAEGRATIASGVLTHAEGYQTVASNDNAHAEGGKTIASGMDSHAEGSKTIASGRISHAEGDTTIASGNYGCHAEGNATIAAGNSSHAEGQSNYAAGTAAHAEGIANVAGLSIFDNITGGDSTDTITVLGDRTGVYTAGLNVVLVGTESGYESVAQNTVSSSTYDGGTSATTIVLTTASAYYAARIFDADNDISIHTHVEGAGNVAAGYWSHAEGQTTIASGWRSHSQNFQTISSGEKSHAGGDTSIASGSTSFVHSTNSTCNHDRSAILGGQGITSLAADTVYVPNLEIPTVSGTIIMTSADGTRYKVTMQNGGTLAITAA